METIASTAAPDFEPDREEDQPLNADDMKASDWVRAPNPLYADCEFE